MRRKSARQNKVMASVVSDHLTDSLNSVSTTHTVSLSSINETILIDD